MGLFDIFKKKREHDAPPINPQDFPNMNDAGDLPPLPDTPLPPLPDEPKRPEFPMAGEENQNVTHLEPSMLEDREQVMQSSFKNTTLENLCKKIDSENREIEKRVTGMKKKIKELNLDNPEVLDLLNLYENTKERIDDFVREIDRFDTIGWGTDENTAALYKFRACKGLAEMKRSMDSIEKLSEEAGFTPEKAKEILKKPASRLVDELSTKARKKR